MTALRRSLERHGIPAAAAMVATARETLYSETFGAALPDSIFAIASMTKALTSVAAMQLVEQGRLRLDEPVAQHLPQLANPRILEGPILRLAQSPITLRQLLSHTSGFGYPRWNPDLLRFAVPPNTVPPLVFEPGTRWEYGVSTDWIGRLIEAVTGRSLEDQLQTAILQPLGMHDTTSIMRGENFDRLVSSWRRRHSGAWQEDPRELPPPPAAFTGGAGLYSTAADYIRFLQMILRRGEGILQPASITLMATNQIGSGSAGKMKTCIPEQSADVEFHPGAIDGFGLGFLINDTAYPGGRAAGSLAWAGLKNAFYWIDPRRGICAVLMMQYLPFADKTAMAILYDFERVVYQEL